MVNIIRDSKKDNDLMFSVYGSSASIALIINNGILYIFGNISLVYVVIPIFFLIGFYTYFLTLKDYKTTIEKLLRV